jgi:hypothetical protein
MCSFACDNKCKVVLVLAEQKCNPDVKLDNLGSCDFVDPNQASLNPR